ncbi:ATP synthase F0 subunit B [Patescibacteria group bacterium]|nr:ATP synthase F0 subunit B [Patescibacteria group bacterium]
MENLGIDLRLLIAQVINFVLFFIIVKKFIMAPFSKFITDEKQREKDKDKHLQDAKKIEEGLVVKEKEFNEKSQKELKKLLDDAKKRAEALTDEILEKAQKEAESIKNKMKTQMEAERDALYRDVKSKVADLSIELVNEGLIFALDENTKKKVTQRILKNLN